MNEKVEEIKRLFEGSIKEVNDMKTLNDVRVEYLGKQGKVTELSKMMKDVYMYIFLGLRLETEVRAGRPHTHIRTRTSAPLLSLYGSLMSAENGHLHPCL